MKPKIKECISPSEGDRDKIRGRLSQKREIIIVENEHRL